ncbi:hypothetical protein PV04_01779 [Phialophora macrospora]|uniref:Zn(2)-C6 fungal-type domain-containing protein n=1 Tax=Phialophora macrospora TaxID=1851006 RepID=A0A0D2D7X1_9EURO|nr:hypothetical protein PV04_01779 [Phialophora macrospora]
MQACDRCHIRKTRCDRRIPRCGACEKAGAQCLHVDKLRSRNLPRGYVESLESDLRKVEDENIELQRQLSVLRAQLPSVTPNNSSANDDPSANRNRNPVTETMTMSPNAETETAIGPSASVNLVQASTSNEANLVSQSPSQERHTVMPAASMASTRTPADDAVATEVGYLTLTAVGETRYLGSSSGMGLANIISSVLDPQQSGDHWPKENSNDLDGRNWRMSSTVSDAPFPPRNIAMLFIDAYFQHTHITFPLLHRPTFLAAVEQIYSNPTYYSTNSFDAFVFDMVLAIGSANFNRFEESTAGTANHYSRAQKKLHELLNMRGLVPLQTILLLSQHGIFSNLRDTSGSIWHLIGIAARICVELGLHLEPKRVERQTGRPAVRTSPITFEVEMRKRTFWCFYNLDRVVSFTLGRPVALRDEDIDISFPSHLEDEEFGPNLPIQPSSNPEDGSNISPFLHLIKIRLLSGKILSTLYGAKQNNDVTVEEKIRVRSQLYDELVAWRDAIRLLKLEDRRATHNPAFVSCFLSPQWYTAVFNNAVLLLYRPSPYLPYPVVPTKPGEEEGDLQRLCYAAKSSITSYYELHRRRQLNYSWITLHGVFIDGLAYVYGIGLALKDPSQNTPIPDYLEIINDTRACSNILVAICERWSVARSSCQLFNRLSNAVIRDAINAAARKDLVPSASSAPGGAHHHHHTGRNTPLAGGQTAAGRALPSENAPGDSLPNPWPLGFGHYDLLSSMDQFDHMFVADEFKQYSSAFDMPVRGDQAVPSELITGFSQDWPFEDAPPVSQGAFSIPMQGDDTLW